MYILGIGGSNHDYSACLLEDGKVKVLIEDERITRNKHCETIGIDLMKRYSQKYCFDALGINENKIDLVVGNDILNPIMYKRINQKVHLIDHHLAHAASAFYPSEFDEAAILVVDAVGSKRVIDEKVQYDSITYAHGIRDGIKMFSKNTGINISNTDYVENSLGIFYSIITEIIGFGAHQEGKTMGLAPYGTDYLYKEMRKAVRLEEQGKISFTKNDMDTLFEMKKLINKCESEEDKFTVKADIAWAGQRILEDSMIHCVEFLREKSSSPNLCLAGGSVLNSVANYKIYKTGMFKNVFIPPACGDNGTSLGSALYGYYEIQKRREQIN